jgi:hypothetical protein
VVLTYNPTQRTAATYGFGLKVVGAFGAIIAANPETAAFETCVPSRMGTDHCGPAFRSARRRREQRGLHASRAFPMGMTCGACSKLQKQGRSSRSRFFLDMVRTPLLRGGGLCPALRAKSNQILTAFRASHARNECGTHMCCHTTTVRCPSF